MGKITTGQVIDLTTFSQAEAKVGDYKWSHMETLDFNDEHLGEWMLCNGQTCAGTSFATATGETNVPNAVSDGTFLRQAKAGRNIGTYEADQFGSHDHGGGDHSHAAPLYYYDAAGPRNYFRASYGSQYQANGNTYNSGTTINTEGGAETNPKNIALNLYVKVNY